VYTRKGNVEYFGNLKTLKYYMLEAFCLEEGSSSREVLLVTAHLFTDWKKKSFCRKQFLLSVTGLFL